MVNQRQWVELGFAKTAYPYYNPEVDKLAVRRTPGPTYRAGHRARIIESYNAPQILMSLSEYKFDVWCLWPFRTVVRAYYFYGTFPTQESAELAIISLRLLE